MVDPDEEGGDAVCWLGQLCPECGAMPSADSPDRCWRCGRTGGPVIDPAAPDPNAGGA
jgi:ribosomal protein S27AE